MSKDTAPSEAGAAEKPRKSKMMLIIVLVLVVVLAAGGGFWFMQHKGKKDGAHGAGAGGGHGEVAAEDEEEQEDYVLEKPRKPPIFVSAESFTVNLADEGRDRLLMLQPAYEVTDPALTDHLKNFGPMIRGNSLVLLSTKTSKELLTVEGKAKLQAELLEITRKPFKGTALFKQIRQVHFVTFVIQ